MAYFPQSAIDSLFPRAYDVTRFGADASGSTDSTGAIKAAAVVAAANTGVLRFPPGNYRVSVPANTALITITSTLRAVIGAGTGNTTITNSGAGRIIDVGVYGGFETTAATIRDLTVVGGGSSGVNIRGRNYSKVVMENVRSNSSGSHGLDLRNCNNWRITNCRFDSNTGSGVFGAYATARDPGDPGTDSASSANHQVSLQDCVIESNTGTGVKMSNASGFRFQGVVQTNSGDGIDLVAVNEIEIIGYFEANIGTQITLGTGQTTGVGGCKIVAFVQKGTGGNQGIYAYRCTDTEIDIVASGYTAGGAVASVYLDTVFTGTVQGVHSGAGTFIRRFDGTNITASNGVFQFGQQRAIYFANSADHNGTEPIIDITAVGSRDIGLKLGSTWMILGSNATALPTATAALRGQMKVLTNAGAVQDLVVICLREAAGTYRWFDLCNGVFI